MAMEEAREAVGDYKEGWHDPEHSTIRFDSGLSEEVVRKISKIKNEPEWMTEVRVKAYHHFVNRPMPGFGDNIFTNISSSFYLKALVLLRKCRQHYLRFLSEHFIFKCFKVQNFLY